MLDKGCLQKMLDKQKEFGSKFTEFDKVSDVLNLVVGSSKDEYMESQIEVLNYVDHCIEELIEFKREFPVRKYWSHKRFEFVNIIKAKEEIIDALHFFLAIFLLLGMTEESILKEYENKINIERIKS